MPPTERHLRQCLCVKRMRGGNAIGVRRTVAARADPRWRRVVVSLSAPPGVNRASWDRPCPRHQKVLARRAGLTIRR